MPRNASTPATPTSKVSPSFFTPKLPDRPTKPSTCRLAVPVNSITSAAESNFTLTDPPGVVIVLSMGIPRVLMRASRVPVSVRPEIPTKAASPEATRAYFASLPSRLSITAPISPLVSWKPAPLTPRKTSTEDAATINRVVETPATVVVVSLMSNAAEISTKPSIASCAAPPKCFTPLARVMSSVVVAVPKSRVTAVGPVLRSACSPPVSVTPDTPTSDAMPNAPRA